MSANRMQTLDRSDVAATHDHRGGALCRLVQEPVSMSLHQRWRERPRCRALHLTPGRPDGVVHAIVGRVAYRCLRAQFVQENRAARVHIHAGQRACRCVPQESVRARAAVLLKNTTTIGTSIELHHHRADDAGAVLGIVNALRFASTRPVAGPSGIDDACARHRSATTRWWAI